jgi:hypothetical protein
LKDQNLATLFAIIKQRNIVFSGHVIDLTADSLVPTTSSKTISAHAIAQENDDR